MILWQRSCQHPFRELFTIRNISILVEYLLQQFFVMDKLAGEGNYLSSQDTVNLSKVEQHLCVHYKKEFPGIEKLSRISAMSPPVLKQNSKNTMEKPCSGTIRKTN